MKKSKLKPMEERIVDLSVDCKEIIYSKLMTTDEMTRNLKLLIKKYKVRDTTIQNVCSFLMRDDNRSSIDTKTATLYASWNRNSSKSICTGTIIAIASLGDY